jgi:hypothetical protein
LLLSSGAIEKNSAQALGPYFIPLTGSMNITADVSVMNTPRAPQYWNSTTQRSSTKRFLRMPSTAYGIMKAAPTAEKMLDSTVK